MFVPLAAKFLLENCTCEKGNSFFPGGVSFDNCYVDETLDNLNKAEMNITNVCNPFIFHDDGLNCSPVSMGPGK